MVLLECLNWCYPSECTMFLGSIQPLTEISTRFFPGSETSAPWLNGLRQCALVPGHGMHIGLSPHGGRNFLIDFLPVYGINSHLAS